MLLWTRGLGVAIAGGGFRSKHTTTTDTLSLLFLFIASSTSSLQQIAGSLCSCTLPLHCLIKATDSYCKIFTFNKKYRRGYNNMDHSWIFAKQGNKSLHFWARKQCVRLKQLLQKTPVYNSTTSKSLYKVKFEYATIFEDLAFHHVAQLCSARKIHELHNKGTKQEQKCINTLLSTAAAIQCQSEKKSA